MATLTVVRDGRWSGRFRKLKVVLDDETIGGVAANDALQVQLTKDAHVLYVKMDWARSQPFLLNAVGQDVTVDVQMPSFWGGLKVFTRPRSLFGLKLRPGEPSPQAK